MRAVCIKISHVEVVSLLQKQNRSDEGKETRI